MKSAHTIIPFALLALLTACAPTQRTPSQDYSSSATSTGFAQQAPQLLQRHLQALTDGEAKARETFAQMPAWAASLNDTHPGALEKLYQAADEDGRRAALARRLREEATIQEFLQTHEDKLARRLQNGVQARLKKDNCLCEVSVSGTLRYALNQETSTRLQEHARAFSQAHTQLEQDNPWNKKDRNKLQEQVDALLHASFFVHLEAPRLQQELSGLQAQNKALRNTLEQQHLQAATRAEDPTLKNAERKDAKQQADKLYQTMEDLDARQQEVTLMLQTAEQNLTQLQEDYQDSLQALLASF